MNLHRLWVSRAAHSARGTSPNLQLLFPGGVAWDHRLSLMFKVILPGRCGEGKSNYPRGVGHLHWMVHPEFQGTASGQHRVRHGHLLTQPMAQNHIPPQLTHSHQDKVMTCKLFLVVQPRSQVMIKIP